MAYETRVLNNPKFTGYIVKEKVKCGKKNCKCYREGLKHEANYVYYREYAFDYSGKNKLTNKLKKMYIKKSEVEKWNRIIGLSKAPYIITKLDEGRLSFLLKYDLKQDDLWMKAYELYRVRRDGLNQWVNEMIKPKYRMS